MFWALFFTLCSLALAALPLCLVKMHWALGVLVFVLSFALAFALLHVLFLAVVRLLAGRIDQTKPLERRVPVAVRAGRAVGDFLGVYGGVRLHVSGEDKLPAGRFFLVCNHRSLFDPMLMLGRLPHWDMAFVSKPENLRIPLVGDLAYALGVIGIDRENDRAALKSILQAADYMKRDLCSMGIYPEGTRNRHPEQGLLPFHAGSFKTAQRANVPLVICSMRGTEKIMHRLLRRNDVYLDVLAVIPAAEVKATPTAELAARARALIEEKLAAGEGESHGE